MTRNGDADRRTRRPVEEIPVLTEVVEAAQAAGLSTAQVDALVAQIEQAVLEDLAPRLEDAVHQAVRAAVDRALGAPRAKGKNP